jgi:hypothetical protein
MQSRTLLKHLQRHFAIAAFFCLLAANAGLLQAVHLHQCGDSEHDSGKCLFCWQFALTKAISALIEGCIGFTTAAVPEQIQTANKIVFPNRLPSPVFSRAPPFVF